MLRSYTETDLATLAMLKRGRAPSAAEVGRLERELGQPNLTPERDCVLAFDDGGAPIGYAYLTMEPAIGRGVLECAVSPERRGAGVGGALLDEAAARARAAGLSVIDVDVPEADAERRRAFGARGWAHVRTHLHLRRDATERAGVPVPPEMTVRPAERGDAQAVTNVQNAAFAGSWGYAPNVVEEIEYRMFDMPDAPPDPVLLLEEAGVVVGYCWGHLDASRGAGIVGMVGVLPERQGQGLGRVITGAGVDRLLELGASPLEITVDSENPPAVRVYERLGFAVRRRSFWYELPLG